MLPRAVPDSYSDGAAAPPVWSPPDPALAAAGIEGEFVVARVRLLAMALLLIAPTWNVLHHPEQPIFVTGFAVTVAASIAALLIWAALRRGRWRPWIGFASSALDVSLDADALQGAAQLLVGKKNFASFQAANADTNNPVREVFRADWFTGKAPFLCFAIQAEGFLKHMVRNIVGTLVDVGRGKISIKEFERILKAQDRRQAKMTAPPQGLFLMKVEY
jgi:tRNA U38,U39,U40 pseudouridine synthase TruA